MSKKVVKYLRVSSEKQDAEDKVSIDEQSQVCDTFCEGFGFELAETFEDKEKYKKTKAPLKGKNVEPSGKYQDRPGFMALLERIKKGDIDCIIVWDLDRLGRHERVLGAYINALDVASENRKGKPEIKIWDAQNEEVYNTSRVGDMIRDARKENEKRAKRMRMGKIGTLKQGRWPGVYNRLGYDTIKESGKRGVEILENTEESEIIKRMFNWADNGKSVNQVRDILIAKDISQKNLPHLAHRKKEDWTPAYVGRILRTRDYTGQATWKFSDGKEYTIAIPQIISVAQYERVQKAIDRRIITSKRNTKAIAALQYIAFCGQCDSPLSVQTKDYPTDPPYFYYRCIKSTNFKMPHEKKEWYGVTLDWQIWRYLVDNVVRHPKLIKERIILRQGELQAQDQDTDSEIEQNEQRLLELDKERLFYIRQAGKGHISESECDNLVGDLSKQKAGLEEELIELKALRDNAREVQAGINYAYQFLASVESRLPELDISKAEYRKLDPEGKKYILEERKKIIQAVCDKVILNGTDIHIDGIIDVSRMDNLSNQELSNSLRVTSYSIPLRFCLL